MKGLNIKLDEDPNKAPYGPEGPDPYCAITRDALWRHLEEWLDVHADEGFAPVRAAWKQLSSTLGQSVLVKTERRELRGTAEDIDESGALMVRTESGELEKILAGDVEQVRAKRT